MKDLKFIFFGTSDFSVTILDKLREDGRLPSLIVTNPDRPKGRKLVLTHPPVKIWATKNGIEFIQPENLKSKEVVNRLKEEQPDLFIVASYGSIIPENILEIPKRGSINVHTSLLPKLRGASPIETAILQKEKETGTTIMLMDEKMDHGDILKQQAFPLPFNMNAEELEKKLAHQGGKLLVETIPAWINGKIKPTVQDHSKATYCGKIIKSEAELLDSDSDEEKYRKYLAYYVWPKTFFFKNGKRYKVTKAKFEDKKFVIEKVIPEGKNEADFVNLN